MERIFDQALWEMDGIKKAPLGIEESTEFHQVATLGLHKFLTDKIPYNADYFSFKQVEFSGWHIAPVIAFGKIKKRPCDTEAYQLHFVVIILQDIFFQGWQYRLMITVAAISFFNGGNVRYS